ncbi:hypothetical protein [Maritimibacter sp. HL-12]|uniref:hypothetical protein n=1 Tax=Maritimibacter sp. HL-12 TaxID=1162418 RepID=UPI000A0F1EBD|nr:hypothetical protein [Maritimibacter sp. HL-12]SMH35933.1 hypothetical protein SAMN05661107_0663 [Maritimibacter sp. HL-12]
MMLKPDMKKGLAVTLAIAETRRARFGILLLVRVFGERREIEHLGYIHRLQRWRGRWYHTAIREAG